MSSGPPLGRSGPVRRPGTLAAAVAVGVVAVVAGVLRFRERNRTSALDESGYLTAARQWHGAGPQVYTHYFVDRPPLLLALFRVGDAWDGMAGVRLVAMIAAVVAVLVVAATAGRLAGPPGALVAAVFAAALLAGPAAGATEVNGELLAAPFTALGLAAGTAAVTTDGRRALVASAAAGVAGALAVMVKQNMLDVWVFLVAVAVLGPALVGRAAALARLAAGAVGGAVGIAAVLGWARSQGSPPRRVLFAMYGFRWRAAAVLARGTEGDQHAPTLVRAFLLSGLALGVLVALVGVWSARRRRTAADVVMLGLGVTVLFDGASVVSGQQFWTHYLVQLVVPVSLAVGLVSSRTTARTPTRASTWSRRSGPAAAAFAALSCAVATATLAPVDGPTVLDHQLGRAIKHAAQPGDTIVTLPEHGIVTYASGLASPYPYLWRLQSDTLDPRLSRLLGLLDGPDAPDWLVDFPNLGLDIAERRHLRTALAAHYEPDSTFGKGEVYLRQGLSRPALHPR